MMRIFSLDVKGRKPVYSFEGVSPSEMAIMRCALEWYYSSLMRGNSSDEWRKDVFSVIDDFTKIRPLKTISR